MKTITAILVALCVSAHWANAQTASTSPSEANAHTDQTRIQDTPYAVVDRGAHHRVWQKTTYETTPDGQKIPRLHQYTELASGLNYWNKGQWMESKEDIEILPNGTAAAVHGQHQAYFPGNIYEGVIEMVTPDGKRLKSRPLGLSYDDGTHSVLIAELKDSVGQLVGPNQVIYPDAFTDLKADLRYTYTKAGFEQDIILQESPLTPESYGLNPATSRLQVLTEFFNPPQPRITRMKLPDQAGVALTDEGLDFGAAQMMRGRAFRLGSDAHEGGVSVGKSWVMLEGRQFLVEEVPVEALVDELVQLPVPQTASAKPTVNSPRHVVSAKRLLPAPRLAKTSPGTQFRQMAKTADPARGLVLDYVTVNATRTNFVFQGDSTYYISGPIMLWGTNTFEGGTVIKYAANAGITIAPTMIPCGIKWQAGPYCPVVFTAKDDNSVGELISDSTGTPTGYYANAALYLVAPSGVTNISNFRVSYAKQAIFYTGNSLYFNNGQFINCLNGFSVGGASPLYLRNMLFANVQTNFNQLYSGQFNIQNSTFCGSSYLMTIKDQSGQSSTLSLTNCILVNVANCQTNGPSPGSYWVAGGFNGFYNSFTLGNNQISAASYPFQVVGAGSYYLTNGCGFQNVGTTNMDSTLRAALRQRTTCSPIVYSNVTISAATTFSPQATRDTDAPDLGYHYDPLDYVFGGVNAYSNVTFTAGTAMGWFNGGPGAPYSQGYGIALYGSSRANFNGTATNPCVLSRNSMVQEGGNGIWTAGAYLGGFIGLGGNYTEATAPTVALQFTRCFARPYEGQYFRDKGDGTLIVIRANNCEFYSGGAGGYLMYFNYTNCLFVRAGTGAQCDCSPRLSMRNCTMIGGTLGADHWWGATWPVWIENCTFDGTSLTVNDNSGGNTNITYCDFNAFRTNANRLPVLGAHDQIVTNFNWQSSWLGNYYLPTNSSLINTGSVTADVVGLYHFTTQTNQVKETNSVVDIGYHYVAVDTNGNPIDTDGNSIPDYYEDANGNGVYDSGDYGDWISTTDYVTWYVNPGGNNAYSGLVPFWNGIDGPFATINTALAKPLSGNVVNVAAGTYAENVDLRAKNVQVQLNGNVTLH